MRAMFTLLVKNLEKLLAREAKREEKGIISCPLARTGHGIQFFLFQRYQRS
jgi:hypothetical protein